MDKKRDLKNNQTIWFEPWARERTPLEYVVMCLLAFLLSTRVVLQKRKGERASERAVDGLTFILAS